MRTIILLTPTIWLLFFIGCGTSTYVKQEERAVPVPMARDTVWLTKPSPVVADSIDWQSVINAETEKTKIQFQVLLSAEQAKNDSLLGAIAGCQALFNKLKNRATVQTQPPDIKYTPPPVECPPAEQHGVLWKIGFAVTVLAIGAGIFGAVSVLRRFNVV
jgi:hypothetical protein